jgi:hypothetical protein
VPTRKDRDDIYLAGIPHVPVSLDELEIFIADRRLDEAAASMLRGEAGCVQRDILTKCQTKTSNQVQSYIFKTRRIFVKHGHGHEPEAAITVDMAKGLLEKSLAVTASAQKALEAVLRRDGAVRPHAAVLVEGEEVSQPSMPPGDVLVPGVGADGAASRVWADLEDDEEGGLSETQPELATPVRAVSKRISRSGHWEGHVAAAHLVSQARRWGCGLVRMGAEREGGGRWEDRGRVGGRTVGGRESGGLGM